MLSPERVLSLHGLRSGKPCTGGTEAPCRSAHPSNPYPSYSRRYLPLLKSLWQPPEASGGDSLSIPLLPKGEGPTIVFSQHLEKGGQILGIPRIEAENPVKHIRGVSHQRGHYQGHEV